MISVKKQRIAAIMVLSSIMLILLLSLNSDSGVDIMQKGIWKV